MKTSQGLLLSVAVLGLLTYFKLWGYLWREWFTSIDHKKIGVMYMVLGVIMLLRGFADALMMRLQQAMAFGDVHHLAHQIQTAHELRHGMLDLEARVHLQEIKIAVFCEQKLERARRKITDGLCALHRDGAHLRDEIT